MKTLTSIFMILVAGIALAAPPPKRTTVIFNPKSDAEAFSFMPTPATCELHIVASNLLVWAKHDGRQHDRARTHDTTVYVQKRVGQKPAHIMRFGGRKMPVVIGASANGSLLFATGEEFIASGDASTRSLSDAASFFQTDMRYTCPFDVQTLRSPTIFKRRLQEDRTPAFIFPVFRKTDRGSMREIEVKAVPGNSMFWQYMQQPGALPSPRQLEHLWPVVEWDEGGFMIWNGTEWKQFKWDANKPNGE
jgi:hypothetical protein